MEIWSSPAGYEELSGGAERDGGGADPIARELEEGEGPLLPRAGVPQREGVGGRGAGPVRRGGWGVSGSLPPVGAVAFPVRAFPLPAAGCAAVPPLAALRPREAAARSLGGPPGHPEPGEGCPRSGGGGEQA